MVACKGTKNLGENQFLYTGAEIELESEQKIQNRTEVMNDLQQYLKPEPNDAFLGMRPKLWLYNIYDTVKKEKGFKHWVKNKLGEEPVLLEEVNEQRVATSLRVALENNGFFSATVNPEVEKDEKTAKFMYYAKVEEPYVFGDIHLPDGNSPLAKAIRAEEDDLIIHPGERFSLEKLKQQREIFATVLKNEGFYYFNGSYLEFKVDSTVGEKKVEVFTTIKPTTPPKAKLIQKIDEVIINADFEIGDTTARKKADTLTVMNYKYIRKNENFRPAVIARQIRIDEGGIYTQVAEEITISRLLDLGVFKYVNVYYEDVGRGKLRAHVRLSPMKKKTLQVKLQAVTNSNGFAGPATELSFRNRNIFNGAEHYELKLTGAYEWQISGGQTNRAPLNSYEVGVTNSLRVPRFITPFNISQYSTRYVPYTHFSLGYSIRKRVNFFQLNTAEVGYGFTWKETKTKKHNLNPIDVSYIILSNVSDTFQMHLEENPFLRRSYQNQFLLGASYGYTYNQQALPANKQDKHNFYFNGNIDISGNLMHALQSATQEQENTDAQPYEILGSVYSQFFRAVTDTRHYLRFSRESKLASRIIIGAGFPYGNSTVLPYTKQFSIGGSSSIRAFRPRSIGPGTFPFEMEDGEVDREFSFFDQTADIKIETNVEYRFQLVGDFKGAFFVDAGNIWTIREDTIRRGGQFSFSDFLDEFAVGAGFGVRLDIEFFVFRIDLATPLRVPYREKGDRWFLALNNREEIRQDANLSAVVLNIAIGYPF